MISKLAEWLETVIKTCLNLKHRVPSTRGAAASAHPAVTAGPAFVNNPRQRGLSGTAGRCDSLRLGDGLLLLIRSGENRERI